MKIIVTGPNGMLGNDLVNILSDSKTDVIRLGIDILDITDKKAAIAILNRLKADILVHTAAYTAVDDCERERDSAFMVNGEGTANIAEGCKAAGTKMIYISTDYVFDGAQNSPYSEDDMPNPLCVYGKSKLTGEVFVKEILDDYIIIRTSWLFGRNGNNFVDAIIKSAEKRSQLEVVADQTGSPTFSVDLSHAVERLIKEKAHGIIHAANSGECSWYIFAKRILEISGRKNFTLIPINSSQLGRPAPRPKYSTLNCSKLAAITGACMRSWEEALREYIDVRHKT